MKVFVSTHPFSVTSPLPMRLLEGAGAKVVTNRHGRKITTDELAEDIEDADILIAGTEKISKEVFEKAPNLKLISRVGIGLDGIDFDLCRKYGVRVAYTPDAPTMAVAELCIGLMLDLARKITLANNALKQGEWHRYMGMLLHGRSVGILGMGRIGKSLAHLLNAFNVDILVHDIAPDLAFGRLKRIRFVSKEELLQRCDIISVNVPLKADTKDFISIGELEMMKPDALLINTARGGIVNEHALYMALKEGVIAGAAVDVFENEPYAGELTQLDNCLLTCHMGASTIDSRSDMEIQAAEEAVRFSRGESMKNEVFENE
jgi:D-3-phosphoglycerate dehydrogenase